MHHTMRAARWPFALALTVTMASSAHAAMVTLSGTHFDFTYDDTQAGVSLFGAPTVSGDVLQFAPTTWVAKANNAAGFVDANATLNVYVTATAPLGVVKSVSVQERGDYRFRDKDPNDAESQSGKVPEVTVAGQIRVSAGSNESTDPIAPTEAFVATFPPTRNWMAEAQVDVVAWSSSTVLVTIQNLLSAEAYALGDTAFIEKKRVDLDVGVAFIPLPPAVWLFGSALLLVGVVGRRFSVGS